MALPIPLIESYENYLGSTISPCDANECKTKSNLLHKVITQFELLRVLDELGETAKLETETNKFNKLLSVEICDCSC